MVDGLRNPQLIPHEPYDLHANKSVESFIHMNHESIFWKEKKMKLQYKTVAVHIDIISPYMNLKFTKLGPILVLFVPPLVKFGNNYLYLLIETVLHLLAVFNIILSKKIIRPNVGVGNTYLLKVYNEF